MDRRVAEKLYDSGKEPTVAKLLEYDEENEKLRKKIYVMMKECLYRWQETFFF